MEKLDAENASLESIAVKINEIIDAVNYYHNFHVEEIEKQINELQYGKYMTNKEVIEDMKSRLRIGEREE